MKKLFKGESLFQLKWAFSLFRRKRGFTLLEILITTVIIAILGVLVIPRLTGQIRKAYEAEAIENLGAIRSSQMLIHQLTGKFVAAADELGISSALGLLIEGRFYKYKIIDATEENFLAMAIPIDLLSNWLEGIAINKDGFIWSSSSSGGGSSSRGGGGRGGGGRGSGGGGGGGGGGGSILTGSITTTSAVRSTCAYVSGGTVVVPPPINLEVFANTGWLDFSFSRYAYDGPICYTMQRGELINGQVASWDYVGGTSAGICTSWAGYTENNIINGKTYCYRATTIVDMRYESSPSSMVCAEANPNPVFDSLVSSGKNDLNGIDAYNYPLPEQAITGGDDIITFLNAQETPILYGGSAGNNGAYAYYDSALNVIVADDRFSNAPAEMTATLLSHEVLHNMWTKDWADYVARVAGPPPNPDAAPPSYGLPPEEWVPPTGWTGPRSDYSLFEEYSSFVTDAQTWYNLKSSVDRTSLSTELQDDYDDFTADMERFLTFSDETKTTATGVVPFDDDMIRYLEGRGYAGLPTY